MTLKVGLVECVQILLLERVPKRSHLVQYVGFYFPEPFCNHLSAPAFALMVLSGRWRCHMCRILEWRFLISEGIRINLSLFCWEYRQGLPLGIIVGHVGTRAGNLCFPTLNGSII